jgi:hypothetical protein
MADVKLSVSVDDTHLECFSDVVRACTDAGMDVEHQMETVGVISGKIDETKLESLRRVGGVAAVEPERTVGIAPPESEVQ